jgi:membrane associated rhomboid family serine protease
VEQATVPAKRSARNPAKRDAQRQGIELLLAIVAVMWIVEVINSLDHYALDNDASLIPRDFGRIWAIFTSPFLHVSWQHLIDNSIPLLFLGLIIALAGASRVVLVTLIVIVVGGLGTWLIAPGHTETVGASGLVFGYAAYLLTRGIFDRNALEIVIGVIVAVVWGGALLSSLVPHTGISWQGHLCGAIGGVVAAWVLADRAPGKKPSSPSADPATQALLNPK